MTARVLDRGADIEHEKLAPTERRRECGASKLLTVNSVRRELSDDLRDLAQLTLGNGPQCQPEPEHALVRQSVDNAGSLPLCFDEPCRAQGLQVLRGVGDRDLELGRKRIDVAWRLGKQVEEFQPLTAPERSPHARELLVQPLFEDSVCHVSTVRVEQRLFKSSIVKLTMPSRNG